MNLGNKKLVIFDFDGVLANTIQLSFNIHKECNPDFTIEKLQEICNGNFIDNMKHENNNKNHNIPTNFYEKYKEQIMKMTIDDILSKTIIELNKNYILAIVSSTTTVYIRNFLEKENVDKCFSDILGADIHSDKTIKINSLLEKYNIKPNNTVFVTDSLGDILEGNKCGVNSIGVTWGIHSKENLEKGNPIAIIDDPRNLLDCIKNVLK